MSIHENSWKNKRVFEQQLKLNLTELKGPYPSHWKYFELFIKKIKKQQKINNIIDIGCGCGAVAKVLYRIDPSINYTGIDYSDEAILIASEQWHYAIFIKKDYRDLTKEEIAQYDIVNASSLHNILENGDKALEFILNLNPEILFLEKIITTNRPSYVITDRAYDLITTYRFHHNKTSLYNIFAKYNYIYEEYIEQDISHFLLRKKYV